MQFHSCPRFKHKQNSFTQTNKSEIATNLLLSFSKPKRIALASAYGTNLPQRSNKAHLAELLTTIIIFNVFINISDEMKCPPAVGGREGNVKISISILCLVDYCVYCIICHIFDICHAHFIT